MAWNPPTEPLGATPDDLLLLIDQAFANARAAQAEANASIQRANELLRDASEAETAGNLVGAEAYRAMAAEADDNTNAALVDLANWNKRAENLREAYNRAIAAGVQGPDQPGRKIPPPAPDPAPDPGPDPGPDPAPEAPKTNWILWILAAVILFLVWRG